MSELVGLVPAAGMAKRISPLPGSKELFPVGFQELQIDGRPQLRPKVVSQYVIDQMFRAGARKIWIVLGKGKWDIMHYYGDGQAFGGNIAYLMMDKPWGMPYTLDQAYPWLTNETIMFGMPDTIFSPNDVYVQLLQYHSKYGLDVALGLFPTTQPHRFGMTDISEDGRVIGLVDKPKQTELSYMWGCAIWSPTFSSFMHEWLHSRPRDGQEVVLGDVFQAAIDAELKVYGFPFGAGEYVDVGSPEDLVKAVHRFSEENSYASLSVH